MPFTENHGATSYWDEQESREPRLLIMGLSSTPTNQERHTKQSWNSSPLKVPVPNTRRPRWN